MIRDRRFVTLFGKPYQWVDEDGRLNLYPAPPVTPAPPFDAAALLELLGQPLPYPRQDPCQ